MDDKYCPLKFSTNASAEELFCEKKNCAWWNSDYKECLLSRIARELVNIESTIYKKGGNQ